MIFKRIDIWFFSLMLLCFIIMGYQNINGGSFLILLAMFIQFSVMSLKKAMKKQTYDWVRILSIWIAFILIATDFRLFG